MLSDFASWGSAEYKDTEYCGVSVDTPGRITEELLLLSYREIDASLIQNRVHTAETLAY